LAEIYISVWRLFLGLPATLKNFAPTYGVTASETRGSICVQIFDNSKSIDYLGILTQ